MAGEVGGVNRRLLATRLVDRISAGLKARMPPQTMADIPFSVRKAARAYIEHINRLIRFPPSRGSPLWGDRGRLHDKLLRELEKFGIRYSTRAEAEQIARDIVKRRWRAKKSAGLKAGRVPPQTMADLPVAVLIAVRNYIGLITRLMSWETENWDAATWRREEGKRRGLHERLLSAFREAGVVFRDRADSEEIAIEISKRRWRA